MVLGYVIRRPCIICMIHNMSEFNYIASFENRMSTQYKNGTSHIIRIVFIRGQSDYVVSVKLKLVNRLNDWKVIWQVRIGTGPANRYRTGRFAGCRSGPVALLKPTGFHRFFLSIFGH